MAKYEPTDPTEYRDTQYLTILEDEWPAARAAWEQERGPLD